ncbi:DUF983 domain-containing protein [Alphaproteobacteria bacterium]|nr:DUF983 domain-containing protein [Alphaproteobacteria bacterium]
MSSDNLSLAHRSRKAAMWKGARGKCPSCGEKTLFRAYLKIADACSACHLALDGHQADDAPPYFTIFIVGHIIVPVALIVERAFTPPLYLHALLFSVLAILVSLLTLPVVKGAVVGLQWALRLHGFAPAEAPSAQDIGLQSQENGASS